MSLYTVRFKTKKLVHKYDAKGKVESVTNLPNDVCLTALPHHTAMSYSGCDDFVMTPYEMEDNPGRSKKKIDTKWADDGIDHTKRKVKPVQSSARSTSATPDETKTAAETGDLGAAINAA